MFNVQSVFFLNTVKIKTYLPCAMIGLIETLPHQTELQQPSLLQNARSLIQPPVVNNYPPHQLSDEVPVYCTEVEVKEECVNVTCQFAGEKVDEIQALLQVCGEFNVVAVSGDLFL